jgi:hypothetical protein
MIARADIRRMQEWMGHADLQTTIAWKRTGRVLRVIRQSEAPDDPEPRFEARSDGHAGLAVRSRDDSGAARRRVNPAGWQTRAFEPTYTGRSVDADLYAPGSWV